jgi:hypothetical protein
VEDGRKVLGQGFVVGAGQAGAFEAVLPAGRYLLEIQGPDGARSAPKAFDLSPGLRVNVAEEMPVNSTQGR